MPLAISIVASADSSAASWAGPPPVTGKFVPASAWKFASIAGSLIQSCAQAARACSVTVRPDQRGCAIETQAEFCSSTSAERPAPLPLTLLPPTAASPRCD
jgi:hypothetical protein